MANNMYDPDVDETFTLTYSGPDTNASLWWDEAEPIWVTAVKSGLKAGGCLNCVVDVSYRAPPPPLLSLCL